MIIIKQIFLHHILKNIAHRPRQSQPSQKMKIYPQNPTYKQNPQQMHLQNPFNTQSFQSIQPQNPMLMHFYQPAQMQNDIRLPYYLQQHEITKNQLSNFSQMPNAAESLQMTMNPYLIVSHKIGITDRIAKITKITIHDRIQTQQNLFLDPVPIQTQGIDTIPIINNEIHHTTEIESIHIIEI